MNLVIDSNILISALIKNSFTRKMIILGRFQMFYPRTSLEEINKYKDFIKGKAGFNEEEYQFVFNSLLNKINLVEDNKFSYFLEKAEDIIGKIDIKDVPFIALALAIENDGIWSEDSHFEEQDKIKVWKTEEIYDKFVEDLKDN